MSRAVLMNKYRGAAYGLIPQILQKGVSAALDNVAGTAQTVVTVPILGPNDRIVITRENEGGTLGQLSVPSSGIAPGRPGTFVIESSNNADESTVGWAVVSDEV